MFDGGESEIMDRYTIFNRAPISKALLAMSDEILDIQDTDLPCWWDPVRVAAGSPFKEGFEDRYEDEVGKLIEQRDLK